MDDATYDLALSHLEDLHNLCTSDSLSLTALQEKVDVLIDEIDIGNISHVLYKELPESIDEQLPIIHAACMNKNVTLEIIKYLVDTFPDPYGNWTTCQFCPNYESEAYPLHVACCNKDCPSDVIRFLVEHYPPAIKHLSIVDEGVHHYNVFYVEGLPLHYYLSRNKNVDFDTVKMLVEAYPQSLRVTGEDVSCYPIHALFHNENTDKLHEILTYLLQLQPSSARILDGDGDTLLHLACRTKNVTLDTVQTLFNSWPEAMRMPGEENSLPIHTLCHNHKLEEGTSIDILRFILNIDQTVTRERDVEGYLPTHWAVVGMSTEFCKVLISAYPESLRASDSGSLPIHFACRNNHFVCQSNKIGTVQYMLQLDPNLTNVWNEYGYLPIHLASMNGTVETIELLLKHDPDLAKEKIANRDRKLPLHLACGCELEAVQVLFDTYPEAINIRDGDGETSLNLARREERNRVANFLQTQLVYAQQAHDDTAMTTPNEEGYLPLHRALLQGDASLGSIKLLVRGNTAALQVADQKGVLPLHIACRNATVGIVKFLVDSYNNGLDVCDANNDSVLHYACRGGNLDVIKYLLNEHTSLVSTAQVNEKGELPIHLLCEAGKDKIGSDSIEYIEIIWRMLLANPEVVAGG